MFKQMHNPFEEAIQIPDSYFNPESVYSYYPQKSSNTWAWIVCILVLIGGFFLFFIWKEKIMMKEVRQIEVGKTENSLNKIE